MPSISFRSATGCSLAVNERLQRCAAAVPGGNDLQSRLLQLKPHAVGQYRADVWVVGRIEIATPTSGGGLRAIPRQQRLTVRLLMIVLLGSKQSSPIFPVKLSACKSLYETHRGVRAPLAFSKRVMAATLRTSPANHVSSVRRVVCLRGTLGTIRPTLCFVSWFFKNAFTVFGCVSQNSAT